MHNTEQFMYLHFSNQEKIYLTIFEIWNFKHSYYA